MTKVVKAEFRSVREAFDKQIEQDQVKDKVKENIKSVLKEQKEEIQKVSMVIAEAILDQNLEEKTSKKNLCLDLKDLDRREYVRSEENDSAVKDYEDRWLMGEYQGDEDFTWMDDLKLIDRQKFDDQTYFCLIHYSRFTT